MYSVQQLCKVNLGPCYAKQFMKMTVDRTSRTKGKWRGKGKKATWPLITGYAMPVTSGTPEQVPSRQRWVKVAGKYKSEIGGEERNNIGS